MWAHLDDGATANEFTHRDHEASERLRASLTGEDQSRTGDALADVEEFRRQLNRKRDSEPPEVAT